MRLLLIIQLFLNETVNNFPDLFREYFKKHYFETYKQPNYLWDQFRNQALPVAGAFTTIMLDELQMTNTNEFTIARYVAIDQEAASESHMTPNPVVNAVGEPRAEVDPVINSSGGGGPNPRLNGGGSVRGKSNSLCYSYRANGTCRRGSKSLFRHGEPKPEVRNDKNHLTLDSPVANSTSLPSMNRRKDNMIVGIEFDTSYDIMDFAAIIHYKSYSLDYHNYPGQSFQLLNGDTDVYARELTTQDLGELNTDLVEVRVQTCMARCFCL